mgnify:CR=1 FL=1
MDIANELKSDEYAGWSYAGALALAAYLDELDDDLGTSSEFDRVAIRCEFSEYASLADWATTYDHENLSDWTEAEIRQMVEDNATLIEFDGGIIVSAF